MRSRFAKSLVALQVMTDSRRYKKNAATCAAAFKPADASLDARLL
jgi:hypothetical protein